MIDLTRFIRPGDGVWWGQAGAEPAPLVDALLEQADSIGALEAFCGMTFNGRLSEPLPDSLTLVSYGALGRLRRVSRDGNLKIIPCHYSALPRMFDRKLIPSDVGLVQVSPPDANGHVTLGVGVEYVADALRNARVLIAEINHRMPRTRGTRAIHLDAFAATIETDRPLAEPPNREPDALDCTIAEHVASLIKDGDSLQIGVGALPNAVLSALGNHRNLGMHSGLITDGVLDLVDRGVVTGAQKEIDTGLIVTGSAIGTATLYDSLENYPIVFRPVSYTHSPLVLSQLNSLVSVNTAIEVDLFGQVSAEMRHGVQIGAIGGHSDFSRAASLTGARSIVALRSESRGESNIVTRLPGHLVTTSRVDVDAIVTEHGIAILTGCTEAERARRIVAIAAPSFREGLKRNRLGYAPTSQRHQEAAVER